jgi:hypothetical protein
VKVKPTEWFRRYRELQAQGYEFTFILKKLNEEFPEHPEPENKYIGPHAEQRDAEEG